MNEQIERCEDWELAIERRAASALGEAEARALDAHLSGCVRCTEYDRLVRETSAHLGTGPSPSRLKAIDEGLRRRQRQLLKVPPAWLAGFAALQVLLIGIAMKAEVPALGALGALGVVTAAVAAAAERVQTKLQLDAATALAGTGSELVVAHRTHVARQRKEYRDAAVLLVALGGAVLAGSLALVVVGLATLAWGGLVLAAVQVGAAAYVRLRLLTRVDRELADLGSSTP